MAVQVALSGARKAAILLLTLGEEHSSELGADLVLQTQTKPLLE